MLLPPSESASHSLSTRLEEALLRLDERLATCRDWMADSELLFEDWSIRWQQCAGDIAERLARIEREVGPAQPSLRVFAEAAPPEAAGV